MRTPCGVLGWSKARKRCGRKEEYLLGPGSIAAEVIESLVPFYLCFGGGEIGRRPEHSDQDL